MRGRTNITPRTSPAVIGTDVTNKQVTGSAITVGDFVEFTGNTTVWEKLVGPINYQGEHFFNISDTIKGCIFINTTSSQCKFVIFNDIGILKETTLNSVAFANTNVDNIDYDSVNNKIYVLQYLGSAAWYTYNIYVFDISQNYTVTYNRTITLFIPDTYGGARKAVCVRNSYIYCICYPSSSGTSVSVVKYNLDGSTVEDVITLTLGSSASFSNTTWYSLVTEDKFILLSSGDAYKFTFVFSSDNLYATKATSDNNYLRLLNKCANGKLVSVNGYNFLVGMQATSPFSGGLTVFYYDNNNDINVIQKIEISFSDFVNLIDMIVERNENDYRILCAVCGSEYASNDDIYVRLYNFNSISGKITFLSKMTMSAGFGNYYWYKDCKLVDYSGVYNLFFAGCGNLETNNHLAKTKFIVSNDTIIQSEALDLVKKYQNRIDGVAKTSGNVGQTITVCIP